VLSHFQTSFGEKPSSDLQVGFVIRLLLALASRIGWLVHFSFVRDKGKLRSHKLVRRVGLTHLPTLFLLMEGAQWALRDWTEGLAVPLRVRN
jgi:hypothetical protein